MTRITFFEVQEWEKDVLQLAFPDAQFTQSKLTSENVAQYSLSEIISCFIYSTIDRQVIERFTNLKLIATRSTGFDHIDVAACTERGVVLSNVPEYGSATVAEHTVALILSLTRKIYQSVNQAKTLNFEHDQIRGVDLEGKTIGIIGLGKIGQHVLQIARGFGMEAIVYNRTRDDALQQKLGFQYADLQTLLQKSDVVTLHLPFNAETKHVINKQNITMFKKGSYLINTARGGLIETEAIVMGLEAGILEGVALDVLEEEKELGEEAIILTSEYRSKVNMQNLVYDHMLMNHPKVLITPHNAFNSREALARITHTTIETIKAFLLGNVTNAVNPRKQ